MGLVIPVAHDFVCPWCWIGLNQVRRLRREYGVEFEWRAYELLPAGLGSAPRPKEPTDPRRPYVPTRIALAYAAEGIDPPTAQPRGGTDTHAAHEAVEYAKTEDPRTRLPDLIYDAFWLHGRDIADLDVLCEIASGNVKDIGAMRAAIQRRTFAERIVGFDEPAYESGVFYVPTFFIGGEAYAEQTFLAIESAVRNTLKIDRSQGVYPCLQFPPTPPDRPYVYVNMVATIDGKTVTGTREEPVPDLGSDMDNATMRAIEAQSDAVLVGAGSLRATRHIWYPKGLKRIVATSSGDLPYDSRFFTDAPDIAFVATSKRNEAKIKGNAIACGTERLDWTLLLTVLRRDHGVERLLVEGGSEVNASLIAEGLVDEVFLTVAPKVKLGRGLPTYAGGDPLPRGAIQGFRLLSHIVHGDEIFLRYRRDR